mgnify:CR=1 FL=1
MTKILEEAVEYNVQESRNLTRKLDKLFTHRIFGYVIFLFILFLIFQAIFSWASTPMDFIDWSFSELASFLHDRLPSNKLVDLLTEGIIPGIAGVLIFIPQIAILFAFIALLEETGYMARVVFLMDKFMRRFGLNGKSVVPLISGVACAIPAIMSTRTIDKLEGKDQHHTGYSAYELLGAIAGIYHPDSACCTETLCIWLFKLAGSCVDGHVPAWILNGHCFCRGDQ